MTGTDSSLCIAHVAVRNRESRCALRDVVAQHEDALSSRLQNAYNCPESRLEVLQAREVCTMNHSGVDKNAIRLRTHCALSPMDFD